jgi:hypothetical protein
MTLALLLLANHVDGVAQDAPNMVEAEVGLPCELPRFVSGCASKVAMRGPPFRLLGSP